MVSKLIVITSHDPHYLSLIEALVLMEQKTKSELFAIDITEISTLPINSFHEGFLRFFRQTVPGGNFRKEFENLGVQFIDIPVGKVTPKLEFDETEKIEINFAVSSAIYTLERTDKPNFHSSRVQKLISQLNKSAKLAFNLIVEVCIGKTFNEVFVFNGRYPIQKAAAIAAKKAGSRVKFFEIGELNNKLFCSVFSPHERLNGQKAVNSILRGLSNAEIQKIGASWFENRMPNVSDSRNQFTTNWEENIPSWLQNILQDKRIVSIFTSSQDEFMSIGPEWLQHSWDSQYSAIDSVIAQFEKLGFVCVLRIHPNLMTKSREMVKREKKEILFLRQKYPKLIVLNHDTPVNSYQLVKRSSAVVVWNSTIGLEASSMGIPVYCLAAAAYDLVADVNRIWKMEDLSKIKMLSTPSTEGAYRYAASIVHRDFEMNQLGIDWMKGSEATPQWILYISKLLVSGANATPWQSIKASADVWANRGFLFNSAVLIKKLRKN